MNLEKVMKNEEYTANCDLSQIEISDIEFDLKGELNGKLVVAFEHSFSKYGVTFEELKEKGVHAVVSSMDLETDIPCVKVSDIRKTFSKICSNFNGNPEENMRIIFVTGTNGKTSTTKIIGEILNHSGLKTGVIGTLGSDFKDLHWNTEMTTPDPNVLFRIMREMYSIGCECVVMEASSHALFFERLYSLYADVGVLTNCTRDHLDFFETVERYQDSKYKMFNEKMIKWAVVNGDDVLGKKIIENKPIPIVRYGKNQSYEISFNNLTYNNETEFDVEYDGKVRHVKTELMGEFNVYNILAGIATARLLNVSEESIFEAISEMKVVGGRFEKISNDFGINIIIDFAHTPSSMENVIKTARDIDKNAKIITVFGCGGDRDRGKRSIMGKVASTLSDYTVVTTDNPRRENPLQILADIERGINQQMSAYVVISGRKLAIENALERAQRGDFVLILGKGKEDYIDIDGEKYPYSDYETVYEILEKMKAK